MASNKAALKAAKSAIDGRKYEETIIQAQKVLESDPGNYHGNVFLGLAYDRLKEPEKAVNAYLKATEVKKDDPLAWQGLVAVYEHQAGDKILDYRDATLRLAEIYAQLNSDDRSKCLATVEKFLSFAKAQGSRDQCRQALELILPSSPVYEYLEGLIPPPSNTYIKIADIVEIEEKERINKQIGERRTRLGAKIGTVTTEVKREVFSNSPLETLYQDIIDWTTDDSIRYQYEERLLYRAFDTLGALNGPEKFKKWENVLEISRGMVILKREYQLPWNILIEWTDGESVADWDIGILKEYVELFPDSGLGKTLKGYLESEVSPFPRLRGSDEPGEAGQPIEKMSADDCLLMMTDGVQDAPKSILASRLISEYYLYLEEYESVVETCRGVFPVIDTESAIYGAKLDNSRDAINLTLATALIYYQSPKNHAEAQSLFDGILKRKITSTTALIGSGLILEEQGRYGEAAEFLDRALNRDETNVRVRAEAAWCQALDGDYHTGVEVLRVCADQMDTRDPKSRDLKAQTVYRIGMCIWNVYPDFKSRKDRKGAYSYFLEALKGNINYAPAYTILGSYYADYARDQKRARKCFQKAFELSALETEAAERLARSFADSGDWDLVEVVAARVVDSGKARPSPGSNKKGFSWPFAALGVVQLNKQAFADAIVSFQSSLRISPHEYHSWVGLGESYHSSGRYIAATRAFQQAERYESEAEESQNAEKWFARYMLANVKRELGDFEDAIQGYRSVITSRPREFGVSVALVQTLVEYGWRSVEQGFFGRAADCAVGAIKVAVDMAESKVNAFNLWKAVGDACSVFSWIPDQSSQFPLQPVQKFFDHGHEILTTRILEELDGTSPSTVRQLKDEPNTLFQSSLLTAVVAQKGAILVSANDVHAQAVAWYNLGWTEYRAYACLSDDISESKRKSSRGHLKASMKCFKKAIELETGNSEFWNALGLATTNLSPKVAQHSFIRSLFLNDKSARVWTNLGTLYLLQNDTQLANEAFTRAQSSDPDYAQAWLGQGLLAQLTGEPREAQSLFTHAFEIADSSLLLPKRQYAVSTFDILLSSKDSSSLNLTDPIFALRQLGSLTTDGTPFKHLSSLFSERVASYQDASSQLEIVCEIVEQEYEISESIESLARFAHAKADLARNQLASHNYAEAVASAETSLDLSSEDFLNPEQRTKSRLSAHLTAGLASYFLGKMDKAIIMFKAALDESGGAADVVCLLSQVLWAKDGAKERHVAQEQLMDCVQAHPGHVQSTILLGVISLLEDDNDSIEAAAEDLQSLRASDQLTVVEQQNVSTILTAIASMSGTSETSKAEKTAEISTSILLSPSQPYGWTALAEQGTESYPADMALKTSQRSVILGKNIDAEDLAGAFADSRTSGNVQRAIAVAPWSSKGWMVLYEVISI